MRSKLVVLAAAVAASAVALRPAAAAQWIVARDGSGHFTDVQPAVDAAQSGDVIWILPGSYGDVHVVQKALSILGAGADSTSIGALSIESLAAGTTLVAGLTLALEAQLSSDAGTVVLRDCAGQDLAISNCQLVFLENWHGRRGTSEQVGTLWIATSSFAGLAGTDAVWAGEPDRWAELPTPGQPAFVARASALYVTGSDFTGGKGGQGSCDGLLGFLGGAAGGSGLVDPSGDCAFWLAQCTFAAGSGGAGGATCSTPAGPPDLLALPRTQLHWDEQGADVYPLSIQVPVLIGEDAALDFWGQPGDGIMLLTATSPATSLDTDVAGYPLGLDLGAGFANFWPLTRTIEVDGHLTWNHIVPNSPLLVGLLLYEQALLVASPGAPYHPPLLTSVSTALIDG